MLEVVQAVEEVEALPVVIFLKVRASATRPPSATHIRSAISSFVWSFWSEGRY